MVTGAQHVINKLQQSLLDDVINRILDHFTGKAKASADLIAPGRYI